MIKDQLKKINSFVEKNRELGKKVVPANPFPNPLLSNHTKSTTDSSSLGLCEEGYISKERKMLNDKQKNLVLKLLKKEHEKIKASSLDDEIITAHTELIKSTVKAIADGVVAQKPDISKMLEVDEFVDFDEMVLSREGKPLRRYRQKS